MKWLLVVIAGLIMSGCGLRQPTKPTVKQVAPVNTARVVNPSNVNNQCVGSGCKKVINTFPQNCNNGNCPTVPLPANPYKNKTCELVNPYSFRQCNGCSVCIMKIEVNGLGATPVNALTTAQATLMARRAAILEGYKALTERLYGIRINGRDTVRNMILQNSTLRAYVEGLIRGAKIEEEEYKNGIYKVVMSLKFDVADWNEFLRNAGYYIGSYDYY
jgi:hypothetical protein